jgi:ankyrin repeat protein
LLKAAALGKAKIVKTLVEEYLVDPRHTDPYGNTAREKAKLYSHDELAAYLLEMEDKATKGDFKAAKHDKFQRSGTNRCAFDY